MDWLRKAYADGTLPKERLSEMVPRILRSAYAVWIDTWGRRVPPDGTETVRLR